MEEVDISLQKSGSILSRYVMFFAEVCLPSRSCPRLRQLIMSNIVFHIVLRVS